MTIGAIGAEVVSDVADAAGRAAGARTEQREHGEEVAEADLTIGAIGAEVVSDVTHTRGREVALFIDDGKGIDRSLGHGVVGVVRNAEADAELGGEGDKVGDTEGDLLPAVLITEVLDGGPRSAAVVRELDEEVVGIEAVVLEPACVGDRGVGRTREVVDARGETGGAAIDIFAEAVAGDPSLTRAIEVGERITSALGPRHSANPSTGGQ